MKVAFELKHDIGKSEMPDNQLTRSEKINLSTFTLNTEGGNNTEIQLDFVSGTRLQQAIQDDSWDKLFRTTKDFYVCNTCGKVFWEGSHHTAVRETYGDLIDKREETPDYYGRPG